MLKFAKAGLALRQANYRDIFRNLAAGAATFGVAGALFLAMQGLSKIASRSDTADESTLKNAVSAAESPDVAGCIQRSISAVLHRKTKGLLTVGDVEHISTLCTTTLALMKAQPQQGSEEADVLACLAASPELALPKPLTIENIVFSSQPAQAWRIVSGCRNFAYATTIATQTPLLTPP